MASRKNFPLLFCICAALFLLLTVSCSGPNGKGTETEDSASGSNAARQQNRPDHMAKALAQGQKENKIVMVELFDKECPYCQKFQIALQDGAVKTAMSEFVHVKVYPDDEGLVKEFGLNLSPTLLFFKPGGEFMKPQLVGYRSAGYMVKELKNFELLSQGKSPVRLPADGHPDFGKG